MDEVARSSCGCRGDTRAMLVSASTPTSIGSFSKLVARAIWMRHSSLYLLVAEMVKQIGNRPLAGDDGTRSDACNLCILNSS